MHHVSYTKGIYTTTVTVRQLDNGQFQGVVSLARDDATDVETTAYEVELPHPTETEALEEAKTLAQRILGELEF